MEGEFYSIPLDVKLPDPPSPARRAEQRNR
jgi:hypothetical protein